LIISQETDSHYNWHPRCLDFSSECTKMRLAAGLRPDAVLWKRINWWWKRIWV